MKPWGEFDIEYTPRRRPRAAIKRVAIISLTIYSLLITSGSIACALLFLADGLGKECGTAACCAAAFGFALLGWALGVSEKEGRK